MLEGFEGDGDTDGIWPEHEAALTAFLRVQTQWRVICPGDGTIRRTGLDYPGVRAALAMAEIELTPELFAELQLIEAGALSADREETIW